MSTQATARRTVVRDEQSVLAPLERARGSLRNVAIARAFLLFVAVSAIAWVLVTIVTFLMSRSSEAGFTAPGPLLLLALIPALAVAAASLSRELPRLTRERVALWVEEHNPLDFALVTAADSRAGAAERLGPRLTGIPWNDLLRQAARRRLFRPAVAALLAVAAAFLVPVALTSIVTVSIAGVAGTSAMVEPVRPTSGPLAGIRATVTPPAYSGVAASTLNDPASIAALVGSRLVVGGRLSTELDVSALLGDRTLPVAMDGGSWTTRITMPNAPALVKLGAGDAERMVLLLPQPDSVPVVVLSAAVADTVLREPRGMIQLEANARDDLGLASARWEWIVTTGGGEQFQARSGTLGDVQLRGARTAELRNSLDVSSLSVIPGDVIHVRATATDRNNIGGPGVGTSETRTIRIARPDEYDSLTIEGVAPPPADSALLSQRMILLRTERLVARMARMQRQAVVDSSRSLADDQATLRRRVGRLVYQKLGEDEDAEHSHFPGDGHDHGEEQRLDPADILARADAATGSGVPEVLDFEGDETPVVAINRPLLEAYNHMWDAGRALEIADPEGAVPPMRLALEAIQRAREAERYYMRGRPPRVVVDIAAARQEGKSTGTGSLRVPLGADDPGAAARVARLERAAILAMRNPAAAADSLIVLQLEVMSHGDLAAALGEASNLIRAGESAGTAMARARRLASPGGVRRSPLSAWRGW